MKKYFLALLLILVSCLHTQADDNILLGYGWTKNRTNNYRYAYTTIDGVLYLSPIDNYDGTVGLPAILVRYPSGKTNTEFEIPSSIRYIADNAFKGAKNLKKLIFSKGVAITDKYDYSGRQDLQISATAFDDTNIEEFAISGSTSNISSATQKVNKDSTMYNLQGMVINSPKKDEVYVQNGKKYIHK